MNKREELIARIRQIKADRTSLAARLADSDTLLAQLRQERDESAALLAHWRGLAEMTLWAELASGAAVKLGDRVRYLLCTYECVKDHTKALTRSPLNAEYWQEVA